MNIAFNLLSVQNMTTVFFSILQCTETINVRLVYCGQNLNDSNANRAFIFNKQMIQIDDKGGTHLFCGKFIAVLKLICSLILHSGKCNA